MPRTFRFPKSFLWQAIALVVFFAALFLGSGSLLFIKNPMEYGFQGQHSVHVAFAMSATVFGTMLLMGCYLIAAYFRESLTFDGMNVSIRGTFRSRHYDLADVTEFRWRFPACAAFISDKIKSRIDVGSYSRADRLWIIRHLHLTVPAERQTGWPAYCHRVALPLRDNVSPERRVAALGIGPPPDAFMLITRRRYDKQVALCLPLSIATAAVMNAYLHNPMIYVAVIGLVAMWYGLLRFSVPKEGRLELKIKQRLESSFLFLGLGSIAVILLTLYILPRIGFSGGAANAICVVLFVAALAAIFVSAYRMGRRQEEAEEFASRSADQAWEAGEAYERIGSANRVESYTPA